MEDRGHGIANIMISGIKTKPVGGVGVDSPSTRTEYRMRGIDVLRPSL